MRSNLIEIGVLVAGPLDDIDSRAVAAVIGRLEDFFRRDFPQFCFELQPMRRPEMASSAGRVEPSLLLQQAIEDRDAKQWDFVFVVTASELVGNYSPFCFAALSRPLDAAVFSLAMIDPQAVGGDLSDTERIDQISHRLSHLMLHALGHLNGLPPSDHEQNLMNRPTLSDGLDPMDRFDEEQSGRLHQSFSEIADTRLEEGAGRKMAAPAFVIRAAWINRREILQAVVAARPWQFPRRLSRLTLASVSTFAVLLMTAEAWDLGLAQSTTRLCLLGGLSLVATTMHVVIRQQLLVRRGRYRNEQNVVTFMSALAIVMTGMLVTWIGLATIGVSLGYLLFDSDLIRTWASSNRPSETDFGHTAIFRMSFFSASLGLLIGALGASFEAQHYFRHVIFVDEEI